MIKHPHRCHREATAPVILMHTHQSRQDRTSRDRYPGALKPQTEILDFWSGNVRSPSSTALLPCYLGLCLSFPSVNGAKTLAS